MKLNDRMQREMLLAFAVREWGWQVDDFWRATPQDVQSIFKGIKNLQRMANQNGLDDDAFAILRAMLVEADIKKEI